MPETAELIRQVICFQWLISFSFIHFSKNRDSNLVAIKIGVVFLFEDEFLMEIGKSCPVFLKTQNTDRLKDPAVEQSLVSFRTRTIGIAC